MVRLDAKIVDFFRTGDNGWQTRMNGKRSRASSWRQGNPPTDHREVLFKTAGPYVEQLQPTPAQTFDGCGRQESLVNSVLPRTSD
jgi:hypothetical protein